MEAHFRFCADLVRQADHDRYLSTLFAPAQKRSGLFALYAFDVEIARIRDLAHEPMPGEIRLQWWREAVLGERAAEASANPVAAAFEETLTRFGLSRESAVALIDAHRFDVYSEPMQSADELSDYARNTAGTVIAFAGAILQGRSFSDNLTREAALAQTMAWILALLPHHSVRHQIYIPQDVLRRHEADAVDLYAMQATPQIRAAVAELHERAREHLQRVAHQSDEVPDEGGPALLPLAPLKRWLTRTGGADYDPFNPPVISRWLRQWDIWRASRSLRQIGD